MGEPSVRDELDAVRRSAERVDRAIDAVLAVRAPLTELVVSLGRAQGWGQLDLATPSVAASPRKHGELARARLHQQRLQTLLGQHLPELEALGRVEPVLARITPLVVFRDLGGSWLAHWMVRGRIKESIARARSLNQELTAFLGRLAAEGAALRARRAELEERLAAGERPA